MTTEAVVSTPTAARSAEIENAWPYVTIVRHDGRVDVSWDGLLTFDQDGTARDGGR